MSISSFHFIDLSVEQPLPRVLRDVQAKLEEESSKYGKKNKGLGHKAKHLLAHLDRDGGIRTMESCRNNIKSAVDRLQVPGRVCCPIIEN